MNTRKTLTFVLMDPPFESSRLATAMRLMSHAAKQGHNVNVFAYEGAVFLPLASQKAHPNAMHGHNEEEEAHPLSKDWIKILQHETTKHDSKFDWVNCGMCASERGVFECIPGIRVGSPADLVRFTESSDNVLVIPTRG
jgi:tRNA 2-thiouridine synthesizing protein D